MVRVEGFFEGGRQGPGQRGPYMLNVLKEPLKSLRRGFVFCFFILLNLAITYMESFG